MPTPVSYTHLEKVGLEAERILPNTTGMTPHEVLLYQLKNFRRELDKRCLLYTSAPLDR